jgi:tRNA modification GTPase
VRVVRLSGPGTLAILKALFHPLEDTYPWDSPRSLCLGRFLGLQGSALDEGLAVFFAAPRSFTGEDSAEFQGHGSPAVVAGLTAACIAHGARPALPGEFSFRAFLNGKLTVPEAEAVDALTACETGLQARAVAGGSSLFEARVRRLREGLLDLAASWEAHLEFPDETSSELDATPLSTLAPLRGELDSLVADAEASRPLREGWRVALCGAPNVGKSSLFNALLRRERALVTPHPGTTRDVLEETLDLGGLPVVLVDTAGVRDSDDPVESLGVARGLAAAADADGVLLLFDGSRGWGAAEEALRGAAGERLVAVVGTKADLARAGGAPTGETLSVSCVSGAGLDALSGHLSAWASASLPAGGALLLCARQQAGLSRARSACARAEEAFASGATEEVALVDLNECRASLEELLGEGDPEALYDRIFSTFCLGK